MLLKIKNRIISLLQLLLVLIFIIFEELIWEGIAKPIYDAVHSLKILQKIEVKLQRVNPFVILVFFVVLLAVVETFGIYAGMLFLSGRVIMGLSLYLMKIPIAAFTFWLFRATEEKLMQFGWFKWIYERIMQGIDWLKSLQIYKDTMVRLEKLKETLKRFRNKVKERYFKEESPLVKKLKKYYRHLKDSLDK
ncbi:Bll5565 protein [hydrothermal vent metagenome]|uniref:Bll5565 protein n=1 Tax=hydrothermal vent metagenome TaxID=652676 RepID=A0A1W1BDW7_9ZZZZ